MTCARCRLTTPLHPPSPFASFDAMGSFGLDPTPLAERHPHGSSVFVRLPVRAGLDPTSPTDFCNNTTRGHATRMDRSPPCRSVRQGGPRPAGWRVLANDAPTLRLPRGLSRRAGQRHSQQRATIPPRFHAENRGPRGSSEGPTKSWAPLLVYPLEHPLSAQVLRARPSPARGPGSLEKPRRDARRSRSSLSAGSPRRAPSFRKIQGACHRTHVFTFRPFFTRPPKRIRWTLLRGDSAFVAHPTRAQP